MVGHSVERTVDYTVERTVDHSVASSTSLKVEHLVFRLVVVECLSLY